VNDAYTVLLREKKLPMSLLEDPEKPSGGSGKAARMHLLTTQPFKATFGKGRQRKRPRLATDDLSALLARSQDTTLQCVFDWRRPVQQACPLMFCVGCTVRCSVPRPLWPQFAVRSYARAAEPSRQLAVCELCWLFRHLRAPRLRHVCVSAHSNPHSTPVAIGFASHHEKRASDRLCL